MSFLTGASVQRFLFDSCRCWLPALALALIPGATGCRRSRPEPTASSATRLPRPPPTAPRELLAEGVLRAPSETWRRVRALIGAPAVRLPSTYPLAVTTLIGASPLVAGLIDETEPVKLAVVSADGGVALVLALHVTSGEELMVALANGSDAPFTLTRNAMPGAALLVRKGAPRDFVAGIADDSLVLAGSVTALDIAAEYLARSPAASLEEGESLKLVVRKAALVGPLATTLRDSFHRALDGLAAAAAASRKEHGRAADYGDPAVVMEGLSALSTAATRMVSTAEGVSVSASLHDSVLEGLVEITPELTGATSEWMRALALGDPSPLGELPVSTGAALFWQRAESVGQPVSDRLIAVFGDRLHANDRSRLVEWVQNVDRGMGTSNVVGVLSGGDGPAGFIVGNNGNAEAIHRAVVAVPSLLEIPAIAGPLGEFAGHFTIQPWSHRIPILGETTGLLVRRAPAVAAGGAHGSALAIDVAEAANESRTAMLVGPAGIDGRVAEVIINHADGIGRDPVVARALARAARSVALLGVARFHDELSGADGWATVAVGTDRHVVRVPFTSDDVSARAAIRAIFAH